MIDLASIASEEAATARQGLRQLPRIAPSAALAALAAISLSYYFGARLGFELRFPESPHSVLWPPNAILLAALLLMPTRLWWLCLAAVLPAHIAIGLPAGVPWGTLLGLYLTNVSQALLAAALIKRYVGRYRGKGAHVTTIIFIICGVFAAPIVLSFADVAIAILTEWTSNDYWQAWGLRFLSNAASAVIIVPPILAAAHACRTWKRPSFWRLIEACSLALCVAGLGLLIHLGGANLSRLFALLVCGFLPLLLWGATRFGQFGAGWTLLGFVAATMGSIVTWPAGLAGQNEILMLQSIFLLISIPVLYLGALHEDLRRYLQDLDRIAERYNMAAAAGSIGVWDWNPRTDDFFVHPHLKQLLGYADREMANSVHDWMRYCHPDDRERLLKQVRACTGGDAADFELEHRMQHADGGLRWFLTRGASARDGESGVVRFVGTFVDITERRRTEDELRRLHQEMAHLTRVGMLGQLSGALAHEINQPLSAILANARAAELFIAREPPDLAEVRGALKDIIEADRRAGDVIRHLRAMLRKSEAQFRPLDINAVVREVLDLTHSDLVAHRIAVEKRLAFHLPSVRGDRVQLQQVLLNFIMNACDAMRDTAPEGRVLTVTTASPDDQFVEVCVVDTGGGFSSELQEHLFEPFITTKKNGLGLGLSICRSIAVAHSGSLWAENNAVGGAAFHLSLPAYR